MILYKFKKLSNSFLGRKGCEIWFPSGVLEKLLCRSSCKGPSFKGWEPEFNPPSPHFKKQGCGGTQICNPSAEETDSVIAGTH